MNPLLTCDHGAATQPCIMHEVGRGMVCKNAPGFSLVLHPKGRLGGQGRKIWSG